MGNLHILDIAVIAIYLITCLVIGLYKANKIKDIKDYTLGNGYISITVLTFTIFATYVGAGPTIGVVEAVYSMGMIFAITLFLKPIFWILTAKIFGKSATFFKNSGCISISDIMHKLYGRPGLWVANCVHIFLAVGMIGLQITAIGYLFNYFLMIPKELGVLIGFGVLVVYSAFGGIRAVALTDTFQCLVLLVAIPVACVIAYHDIGGYETIVSSLPKTHTSIDFSQINMLLLISLMFNALVPLGSCTYMQRFLMANDKPQLLKSLKIIAFMSLPFALVVGMIGFIMKVKAPEIDPNTAFFYLIGNYMPIGVTGFLVTGILAAIMSTADSWLNTCSVLVAHNMIKRTFPAISAKQELLIARLSIVLIAGIAVFIALGDIGLMELSWVIDAFVDPIILVPTMAGFLGFRTSSKAFIASVTLGVLGTSLGRYIAGEFNTISALLGVIGNSIGLFGTHYFFVRNNNQAERYNKDAQRNRMANQSTLIASIKEFFMPKLRYKQYCTFFGAAGMVYFLLSSFFMAFSDMNILYTIVYMKAIAAFLCFGLCAYESHLNQSQQERYLKIYWYAVLAYCLPFLSGYTAFIYSWELPWLLNFMLSTILLYIFTGASGLIAISITGVVGAYTLFQLTGYSLATTVAHTTHAVGYVYCGLTVFILALLKQKDLLQAKELDAKLLYSSAIAHQVINPLQGSAMMADTLIKIFAGKNSIADFKNQDFLTIKSLLQPFKDSSNNALQTVDMLLNSVRRDVYKAADIGIYSINECVAEAVNSYGASSTQNKIFVNAANDFKFHGSKHFMKHVINNLISNALKYAGSESEIYIYYKDNTLYFEDNGVGITTDKLDTIFSAFDHSGATKGTGVGLPFCKQVVESFGGVIECCSAENEGAKFAIKLPIV